MIGRSTKKAQAQELAARQAAGLPIPGVAYIITSEAGLPARLPGVHVPGGIKCINGRTYPHMFLADLGGSHYFAGTDYEVPANGDYSQLVSRLTEDGETEPVEVAPIKAPQFLVYWWQICAERDRMNLDSVFDPPNPQGKTLSLVARSMLIAACIVAILQTWGLKSSTQRLADQANVLTAQVARLAPVKGAAPAQGALPQASDNETYKQPTPPALGPGALDPVDDHGGQP